MSMSDNLKTHGSIRGHVYETNKVAVPLDHVFVGKIEFFECINRINIFKLRAALTIVFFFFSFSSFSFFFLWVGGWG